MKIIDKEANYSGVLVPITLKTKQKQTKKLQKEIKLLSA